MIVKLVLTLVLVVSVAANIYLLLPNSPHTANQVTQQRQVFRQTYPFLAGRIMAVDRKDRLINFVDLRKELEEYSDKDDFKKGVFFEYLPSGVSIGIDDALPFASASLLKVPLVMQIYKHIEDGSIKRTDILEIRQNNIDRGFGTLWKRGIGTEITVAEAIKYALIESDNTAKSLLFGALPEGSIDEVFDALDIPKKLESDEAVISAFHYSSILRSLYLSSYLSPASSQEILTLMSQSKYNDKLVAGVPKGTKVAHKIGVYENDTDGVPETTEDDVTVYSDCGIIYAPNRPFMLCIFIQSPEEEARVFMKGAAELTYKYVHNANK